jgi:ABC-type multidrug transport system ATPase subunit
MIELRDLSKTYRTFKAVDGVSFNVTEGEAFALLGPNGSGKSTILKCIAGLSVPTKGEVYVDGLNALQRGREARLSISYLPQRVGFQDCLTAREVLEFYRRLRKLPTGRIDSVLHNSDFDFNGFCDKPIDGLSGGMKQKLGLAVACMPDTPILLLDEPTVSLDPAGAIAFRRFLKSLKVNGKTIIFTSHTLADVEMLADRVAILVDGKLVALESIEDLRKRTGERKETLEEVYLDYAKGV